MKKSTKVRMKAIGTLLGLVLLSWLFFLLSGLCAQLRDDNANFWDGIKRMAVAYCSVTMQSIDEIKFGVQILDEDVD